MRISTFAALAFAIALPTFGQSRDHNGGQKATITKGTVGFGNCNFLKPIIVTFDAPELVEFEIPKGLEVTEVLSSDENNWHTKFKDGHLTVKATMESLPTLMVLLTKDGAKVVFKLSPGYQTRAQIEVTEMNVKAEAIKRGEETRSSLGAKDCAKVKDL